MPRRSLDSLVADGTHWTCVTLRTNCCAGMRGAAKFISHMNSPDLDRASRYRSRMLSVPGFTLYRGMHPQGTELPRHTHDDPTVCYVLRGRFTEYVGGQAVDCLSDSLKVTPAGEA